MEGEMIAGAALGAAFGELLKATLGLMEKAIHVKPLLQQITAQLHFWISVMKQLDEHHELSIDFQQNTQNLREIIHNGKQLILECHDAMVKRYSFLYYPKTPFYTKQLRKLDAQLERASRNLLLQLNIKQLKKLMALENNNYDDHRNGYAGLVQKIKKIFMGDSKNCCSCRIPQNYQTTKLPLLFYHDKILKARKTGPNFVDTFVGRAVQYINDDPKEGVEGRIEEIIKNWGKGRFERIFHKTFETTSVADEKLQNWFNCDLSIILEEHYPHGPLTVAPGVLFVSTTKLAFCSYNHIPHSNSNTKSLYLKVVIPIELLKGVGFDEEQEYIQFISIDDQKFVFLNFLYYNDAKKCMQEIPVTPPTCTRCHTLSLA